MQATTEQQAIVNAALQDDQNLVLNALAGCAKSTTLEMIAQALDSPALYIAFNKRTAVEAEKTFPKSVEVRTLNSLGHRAWLRKIGRRRAFLSPGKCYYLAREMYEGPVPKGLLQTVALAKSHGVAGKGATHPSSTSLKEIIAETNASLKEEEVQELLDLSIAEAWKGKMDFGDQIYMPACFSGSFEQHDLVLIDEAQDFSPMNLQMLERIVKGRLIAVGDPYQSIYAFRGADSYAMARLQAQYEMTPLPLTVNFRCSVSVVEEAQKMVPDLKHRPGAPLGEVKAMKRWGPSSIPEGGAVLCRNNAPLFTLGIRLLAEGRAVTFFGQSSLQSSLTALLEKSPAELSRLAEKEDEGLRDKLACVAALQTTPDPEETLKHLCAKKNAEITLSSGHRAKGFEWNDVFILDRHLIPSRYAKTAEQQQQERNLLYVLTTRAKENLHYISSEDYDAAS